jgi:hypothetical protein
LGLRRFWFPAALATAGLVVELYFLFSLTSVVRKRIGFPSAIATAGYMCDLIFIFIDPCAGRHLLSLLRQRKQRKALHTNSA